MKFRIGDRVKITVDAPPAWAGEWGAPSGSAGIITHAYDRGGAYGVLLDDDPVQMPAAFSENYLKAEAPVREDDAAEKLAALLSEIVAAGHRVRLDTSDEPGIWVGNAFMFEPPRGNDKWVVE